MTETEEELAADHTRRELEEMAEKLGVGTIGIGTKVSLAAAIIKAKEEASAKEMPKPKAEAHRMEVPVKEKLKPRIGKKGVFAKRAAISAQMDVNAEAVGAIGTGVKEMQTSINNMMFAMDKNAKKMRQEGSAKLHKGVDEMQKNINAQTKLNEKAAAKMGTGIKEMHKGIQELQSAFDEKTHQLQIGVKEMHSGVKMIQKGIHQMETKFGDFQNETENYIKDFYYG